MEVPAPQQPSQGLSQAHQPSRWSSTGYAQPQPAGTPQLELCHQDVHNQPQLPHQYTGGSAPQQSQSPGDFSQQLQSKVKGIVKLYEGEVTKKVAKPIDFAKKCSAKWAKKVTADTINLPLFTFGAVSELESSLSGRTEALTDGEFLAKLRHIKNFLDVCCLNSEQTDFKGYGWTIAKDYAMKVEGEVEQKLTTWEEMTGGVQTSQLLLAQMDCPKPAKTGVKTGFGSGDGKDGKDQTVKAKCPTYNTCKTENKCEYELGHPDKKCILKHECSWCRTTLKQSWRHQEWNCKRKN